MGNPNILYDRGNFALQTLTKEINAAWGKPARPYEYVTGYRAADNFTGHNADINGVAHGVDIFVGPGNLSAGQANELTAFLRGEGLKGDVPGHPDRLYYIIYQDRIAGDFSNWEWVGAGYGHWDHIHISTCDLFWGDPAPISPLDYDSTAPWNLTSITSPQSGNITPIPEEGFLMALSDADQTEVLLNLRKVVAMASAEAGMDKGMNEKLDEVVGNLRKVYWNTAEATLLLKSAPPADLAAQIDAAGIAAEVRDELVKLLAGTK